MSHGLLTKPCVETWAETIPKEDSGQEKNYIVWTLGGEIKIREAKGLASKEVALSCKMDSGHYSRIENDKSDPALSSLVKIAKALGVTVAELFAADDIFKDVNSIDKTLMEKISLIDSLDKKEKAAFFTMLDALVAKKKLKDNLSSVLQGV